MNAAQIASPLPVYREDTARDVKPGVQQHTLRPTTKPLWVSTAALATEMRG